MKRVIILLKLGARSIRDLVLGLITHDMLMQACLVFPCLSSLENCMAWTGNLVWLSAYERDGLHGVMEA